MARFIFLLTVYYNGEFFFKEMNQTKTRIACGGHVCCSFHPDPLSNMATTGNSCF
jgi:hypothetical protein